MRPVILGPNLQRRAYRGGQAIAAWRGHDVPAAPMPEDWLASTTTVRGTATAGLTRLPDGRTLREAIAADPIAYLGPDHVAAFGEDPALLVKLLDAGQRLPVHYHPDRAFANRYLGCTHGKTEAWVVIATSGHAPCVHLGFRRDVRTDEATAWVGHGAQLLGALNTVPVAPGDAILVPAGIPHAIGPGVFVAELQEPTDLSFPLESAGYLQDVDGDKDLGLSEELLLTCLDRSGWSRSRLATLHGPLGRADETHTRLLPSAAEPFFRAERLRPLGASLDLAPSYAILLILAGQGSLTTSGGDRNHRVDLTPGITVLVPYGAGPSKLDGDIEALRCLPPNPPQHATRAEQHAAPPSPGS